MVLLKQHIHLDSIYRPGRGLKKLFYAGIARRIAISFLSFFSAVYVYDIYKDVGYGSKSAIYMVLLYYLILVIAKQVSLSYSENLSQRVGFEGVLRFSIFPFMLLIIFMILGQNNPMLLFLAALSWGLHAGLFWWGYHGYFMKTADSNRFGEGIGEVEMLKTIVTVISPIAGAFLIRAFGFSSIYIISALFMMISIYLVDNKEKVSQKHDVDFSDVLKLVWKHKSVSLTYAAMGAEGIVYTVAWSLFLYFFFGSVLGLGGVISFAILLSAVYGYFVGKNIDTKGESRVISFGIPLMSLSWIFRIIVQSVVGFVVADSLRYFGDKMVNLPLIELSYKKGVEGYTATAILFREFAIGVGAIFSLLVIFLIVYFGGGLSMAFIASSIITLLPLVAIIRKKI